MNISTALPIQPGSLSLVTGAASTTGGAGAFAALIGGGVARPMPIRVTDDAAASGGQVSAVIGNIVPLEAPDMGPDILVDPDAPVVVPSVAERPVVLDDPAGVGDPSPNASLAKGTTIPGGSRTNAGALPSRLTVSGEPITADPSPVVEPGHEAGTVTSSDDTTSPAAGGADAAGPIVDPRSLVMILSPAPGWSSGRTPLSPGAASPDRAAAATGNVPVTGVMVAQPETDPSIAILPAAAAAAAMPPARADEGDGMATPARAVAGQGKPSVPGPRGRPSLVADGKPLAVVPSLPPAAPTPLAAGAVAPAGELFAAAIHAAGRSRPDPGHDDALPSVAALAGAPVATAATTGADADRSLDLAHPGWPGAMIEHIERLRDAADAVDTRIRLVPDALGGIDVSLRRHDDGVHVALSADRPATAAILAEARPQLDALAEARGLRLADATAGSGAGGLGGDPSSAHDRPRPAAFVAAAPARATATDTTDPADGRVA